MGSAVALLAGLTLTFVVFLALPDYHERLGEEFQPLLRAIAWAALLAIAAVASFVGQIKMKRWRLGAQAGLLLAVALVAWAYWPA